jgi:cytochrome c peroxidase
MRKFFVWSTVAVFMFAVHNAASAQTTGLFERTEAIGKLKNIPSGKLDRSALDQLTEIGNQLFKAKFSDIDGVGRPGATQAIIPTKSRRILASGLARTSGPDAGSCAACHNDPVSGGAGDFVTNVFVSEGFTNANFDTTDPQFSNERGTNHLFGAGLVELLAREMSDDLSALRRKALVRSKAEKSEVTLELISKGVLFGFITASPDGTIDLSRVDGVDDDLVIRPFSQKGVMTSLRQFTINAANHHHGMQAEERFGARWTGDLDFDEDGVKTELMPADISALVAWQATLPAPSQKAAEDSLWQEAISRGEENFSFSGCDGCHIKALPLNSALFTDPGPFDVSGTLNTSGVREAAVYDLALFDWFNNLPRNADGAVMVPLFGDLKRHKITDRRNEQLGNELLSQRFVERNIFLTAELWGVGSTAPYGHRNDFTTLDGIIKAHGGEAEASVKNYEKLDEDGRRHLITFLQSLVIEQ